MGIKIIIFFLAIIDLILLFYLYHYYKEYYKKGLDKIEITINRLKEKVISSSKEDKINDIEHIEIKKQDKLSFDESFKKLNNEQKNYYNQIVLYTTKLENTKTYSYKYDKKIKIDQKILLLSIYIKNDNLEIKIYSANIDETNKTKPIKIIIMSNDDVIEAQNQISIAYNKYINKEGEHNND